MGTITPFPHKRRYHKRYKFKIGRYTVFIFFIVLGLYFFIHSAFFSLKNIQVSGIESIDKNYIIEQSNFSFGTNIFKLDFKNCQEKLLMHPLIDKVEIFYNLPNAVTIKITERETVALVVVDEGFIEVSSQGHYLKKNAGYSIKGKRLPVITGIKIDDNNVPGLIINNENIKVALMALEELDTEVVQNIIEINVNNSKNVILLINEGIEVRLGTLDNIKEKGLSLLKLLNDLDNNLSLRNIEYIDLRYNSSPVIKTK